jgi:hypothetical protein
MMRDAGGEVSEMNARVEDCGLGERRPMGECAPDLTFFRQMR